MVDSVVHCVEGMEGLEIPPTRKFLILILMIMEVVMIAVKKKFSSDDYGCVAKIPQLF